MKKTFLLSLTIVTGFLQLLSTDRNDEIVELAKIYRNFMFRNSPSESALKQFQNISSTELAGSLKFIRETISTNNNLTSPEFLTLPDEQTLKYLYIIRRVNWNLREENPRDNNDLINELMKKELIRFDLIDSYYDMLFSGVGNKNQPFNLSATNFEMSGYGLKNDTEKAIFFFKAMDLCGMTIWGYMNVVKPPNYKLAMEYINKYPKFNGQPYFEYLDFGFTDFEMEIEKDKGKESYKAYYLNQYYDTLLSHLECLSQKRKDKETRSDLLLGSILKEENYYKYSKKKNVLESLFTTMQR